MPVFVCVCTWICLLYSCLFSIMDGSMCLHVYVLRVGVVCACVFVCVRVRVYVRACLFVCACVFIVCVCVFMCTRTCVHREQIERYDKTMCDQRVHTRQPFA